MIFATADPPDPISVPKVREAVWVERLVWLFMLSFALDYRSPVSREGGAGAGLDQLVFLGSCVGATLGIVKLGWRYLTVRPGVWLIGLWALFITFMLVNSTLQGVAPSRSIRVILPLVFCLGIGVGSVGRSLSCEL